VLGRVLFGEGDVQVAADVANSERGEAGCDGGVVKLLTRWKLLSKTSMVPKRKLVA
jgi:hypothetical protein